MSDGLIVVLTIINIDIINDTIACAELTALVVEYQPFQLLAVVHEIDTNPSGPVGLARSIFLR